VSSSVLTQIEETFSRLSYSEQLHLLERLVHQLKENAATGQPLNEMTLAEMAADPEIQHELKLIEAEFMVADADGLENV